MADVAAVVADTVRRERGPILGRLARLFGNMDAAEEALQEAALAALEAWRDGVPPNPGAWLMTAAKNAARDARRHEAVVRAKAPLLAGDAVDAPADVDTVTDDYLRLVFACSHPALALPNQVALTLKVVCGFTTEEIARAFLATEATVSQRILRAKQTLAMVGESFAIPERSELPERVGAVLSVIYALYNEGHVAQRGAWMRVDLQAEALRLARLVCDLVPHEPEAFGLLALIAFGAARAKTRVDADGNAILLAAQDRARWDKGLLREGLMACARARSLGGRGSYVVQAAIAAVHVTAPTWEATDWATIVALYDALDAAAPSPIVKLNRAIALAMRDGPEAGLEALAPLGRELASHHLFHATRAELLERAGRDARPALERALTLVTNDAERKLLEERLARVRA
jgi:predicted RNA polymerase sigma factor